MEDFAVFINQQINNKKIFRKKIKILYLNISVYLMIDFNVSLFDVNTKSLLYDSSLILFSIQFTLFLYEELILYNK
jgi:hypothetical protein